MISFQETELPEREASKREHGSEPYPSPTHAGGLINIYYVIFFLTIYIIYTRYILDILTLYFKGLFAINRDYFLTLGAYDPGEIYFMND